MNRSRPPALDAGHPYAHQAWWRATEPVRRDPASGAWMLTRHADCVAVLTDPRCSASAGQRRRHRPDQLPTSMLTTDPPGHAGLRGPAAAAFSPARLARWRDQLSAVAAHYVGRLDGRRDVDVLAELAAPVAVAALALLLGVPREDLRTFASLARAAAVNLDPLRDAEEAGGRVAADALAGYLRELAESGRADPEAGVAAVQEHADRTGRTATTDELVASLTLFVIGGYEPLLHLVGNGLLLLATHDEQRRRLREERTPWVRVADELLRLEAPIPFTARVCLEDVVLPDAVVPAGDTVVAVLAAANRDPAVFDRPEELDLTRSPNPMLAFGAGPHTCLAAALARVAGEVVLRPVVEAFPTLRVESYAWRRSRVPRGLSELLVSVC